MAEDGRLATPVTGLRGVGPALAQRLARLGVATVGDLVFLLPLRYEDRTRIVPIGELRPGMRVGCAGEVELAETVYRRRRQLLARVADGTGRLTLRFFHFSRAQAAMLRRGARLRLFGEVRAGPSGLEIVHPEYALVGDDDPVLEAHLTPIYPLTEGLAQPRLRDLVRRALVTLAHERPPDLLAGLLPDRLPDLVAALELVHRPPPDASLAALEAGRHPAQRRLALEELVAHQVGLRQRRETLRRDRAARIPPSAPLLARFLAALPFRLTGAQRRVLDELLADLNAGRPMLRLVQGDVGSGKTVVAAAAAVAAVAAGHQVAVMAPTELLAEQHFLNFDAWLAPLDVPLVWLAGSVKGRRRTEALSMLAGTTPLVAVGTHALFQEAVDFGRLALVIVDEQHRFGVHQRLALREKGEGGTASPHQLIMTATPIPRTLAMTAYADLDSSVIDELPPGREPVTTVALPESRRDEVVARIRAACAEGRQVYWVCPLIETSEHLDVRSAEAAHELLVAALPDTAVGLIHGRLSARDKELVMARFKAGELRVLVATTVIEVGVDVPAATLMVIENAERMGLSQLHQLRGRVGRGGGRSTCVLMYRAPLARLARERLAVMRETGDGFEIARRDLELRGPGELLGTRQTGLAQLRIADLVRDADLLPAVTRAAARALDDAPRAQALIARWIGDASRFGAV